jgi:putative integral membrane protein (TIGR02587 family)
VSAWRQEVSDFVRALSGAFLFGTPLLFTMEMWDLGVTVVPWRLLLFLAVALLALNRISLGDPLGGAAGKVAVQTVPLALGASVANAVFARGGRQGDDEQGSSAGSGGAARAAPGPWTATLIDVGATMVGAVFVCVSIVPTDEVPLLATGMTYWHELALIALTLAVSYAIVFASGFDPEGSERPEGILQHPLSETAVAYVVSLAISLAALLLFNRVTPEEPLGFAVAQTLVLAFPAAVGGAAGRLVA